MSPRFRNPWSTFGPKNGYSGFVDGAKSGYLALLASEEIDQNRQIAFPW
jgi:hypothetical protein